MPLQTPGILAIVSVGVTLLALVRGRIGSDLVMAGGIWSAVSLSDKPCSMLTPGQSMDGMTPLTSREAYKAIYAKQPVIEEDRGR